MLHLALSLFPGCISSAYILHISCRLLPTCIGSFHVFFICQMCPFPSCICSFYFSSICNFCLFSTCILFSHFFCNCHVCLFQLCIFQFHFLHCFSIFSRCKHPRTSAIRQHIGSTLCTQNSKKKLNSILSAVFRKSILAFHTSTPIPNISQS